MTDEYPTFTYDPNTHAAFDLSDAKSLKIIYRIVEEPTEGDTMTDQPTRADWWREVTDLDEVIPAGCPARAEWPNYAYEAYESIKTVDRPARYLTHPLKGIRVFIDSRWTPSKPAYKVGDVIEKCTDATLPADGVGIVDAFGFVGQMDDGEVCWALGGGTKWASGICERELPLTVIYVPKAGGDDD